MNEERAMVLKMLDEGKITAEEAMRLLEVLKENDKIDLSKEKEKIVEYYKNISDNMGQKTNVLSQNLEEISQKVTKKINKISKKLEPKIQKAGNRFVEKTSTFVDKISKTLSDPDLLNKFNSSSKKQEIYLELDFEKQENAILNIVAKNGSVKIKGTDENKITAKLSVIGTNETSEIKLIKQDETILLDYNEENFEMISGEVLVPKENIDDYIIKSTNGKVIVENVACININVDTTNGSINVKNNICEQLELNTKNSRICIENTIAKSVNATTTNALIELIKSDILDVKATTSNDNIIYAITDKDIEKNNEYNIVLKTTNAMVKCSIPEFVGLGYYLKATNNIDNYQLNMKTVNYIKNEENNIEVVNSEYDNAVKKINLNLDTTNAPIILN